MEEPEDPTENVREEIHHRAEESGGKWLSHVALSTAVLAGLAALASMLSGHHANEAILDQIRASDQWAYYQAKGVKSGVLESKGEMLAALGKPADPQDAERLQRYEKQQEEIREQAGELQRESERHLHRHTILARGVTMFQVAIAVAAISVLMHSRRFWYLSMGLGALGVAFLVQSALIR